MKYIYINGEVFVINLEEAENENFNSLLNWIEERS